MSTHAVSEFSFPVDVTGLPPTGRSYTIKADEAARARVAARLGLRAVGALSATFELTPRAGGLVKVTGAVKASVTQTCVVTLVPVPATVEEEVESAFSTFALGKPAAKPRAGKSEEEAEELVSLEDEEPPEEALDGRIDLGELAVEHLALGLDPYPRAPGAAFEGEAWDEKGKKSEVESPFAILAQLKKKDPAKGA